MPVPFRSRASLAFVMFVIMWLLVIAQSPGGMSALAHEVIAVEQQLLPAPPDGSAEGEHTSIEAYAGGVICEETANGPGEPEVSCHVAPLIPPY